MKISIKDIFDSNKNLIDSNEVASEKTENEVSENRMIQLSKALEQKDVVLKEEKNKEVNQEKVAQEIERIKEVARLDESWGMSVNKFNGQIPSQFVAAKQSVLGQGQTVNTFLNNNTNPNSNGMHNPNFAYLSDAEALRLAISRTLNSGAPVNNLGFYEEVNQTLNNLGFLAKPPLAIKEMIIKLINN